MKLILVFSLLLMVCCNTVEERKQVDDNGAIRQLMAKQAEAWNQGDMEGFMHAYWKSDSLTFVGRRGLTYGWEKTLSNYKNSYPVKDSMGTLQFDILQNRIDSPEMARTIGKWTLYRSQDTLSGHFSLVWKRISGDWKIISDHSS